MQCICQNANEALTLRALPPSTSNRTLVEPHDINREKVSLLQTPASTRVATCKSKQTQWKSKKEKQ